MTSRRTRFARPPRQPISCPTAATSGFRCITFAQLVPNRRARSAGPEHSHRDTLPPLDVEVPVLWPPEPPWEGLVRPGRRRGDHRRRRPVRDDEVDVRLVLRIDAVAQPPGGESPACTQSSSAAEGQCSPRGPVYRLTAQAGCGCGCAGHPGEHGDEPAEGLLEAMLIDPGAHGEDPGTALRIVREGTELWRRDRAGPSARSRRSRSRAGRRHGTNPMAQPGD